MSPEENAAYIFSQVSCALIEAMGMEAENKQRELTGYSPAFVYDDFKRLIEEKGIYHNAVIGMINELPRSER